MQLFVQSNLARRGSRDVLRDLAHLSLHVMLDARLETADDADQVVRSINVLVLKMVEKSDHTAMTRYINYLILLVDKVAVYLFSVLSYDYYMMPLEVTILMGNMWNL